MNNKQYQVGIYCRLSKDDNLPGESMSIGTQRTIIEDYCADHGYSVYDVYIDDGYSGLNFSRPDFQRLLRDVDNGLVNMVITKDLSRLGRDYITTGYYIEIYFPSIGVRYIAISDGFDSENDNNDIAPFKNILNDMYARDISRKVKTAKRQRAKQGLFISGQAPYGYKQDPENKNHLVIDEEAADTVRQIFALARSGMGDVNIAKELRNRKIIKPAAYKYRNGDTRFAKYGDLSKGELFKWCPATVRTILRNQTYLGHMINHRTEVTNYKTKKQRPVPREEQIIVFNTHEAIITQEEFEQVWDMRKSRNCPADCRRDNLFRGLLFCGCCGSALSIAHRKLTYKEDDVYRCMKHIYAPKECPKTHMIYHEELYAHILAQIKGAARSMKRRKINSPIAVFSEITELTPEVLNMVIERIEVGHLTRKSRLSRVVKIQWKLK